ncbi:RuvB-like protein 2 [Hanseniaspora valbyensis]
MSNITTKDITNTTSSRNILNGITPHSHIKNLGLKPNSIEPEYFQLNGTSGMVGQIKARKALAIISKMIVKKDVMGKSILLAGAYSTGKTALAKGLAGELNQQILTTLIKMVPMKNFSGSEVYSLELSKTETLTQFFRRAIGIRIKEVTELICGEVVELIIDRSITGGQKQGKLTIKTTDMETVYELGTKMIDNILKEKINGGDVITIDKANGKITKLGRSLSRSRDYDAMGVDTKFVKCPEGELQQRKTVTHTVSLHDIDVINSRTQGVLALFSGDTGEISKEIRDQIDNKVTEWKEEGKAEIVPGVLFIDECHMLDLECCAFINRALEMELAPIVIMATNRGLTKARGSEDITPHGLPADLLDRCIIVPVEKYEAKDLSMILKIRSTEEEVEINDEGLQLLTKIGQETSLRYSCNLLAVSNQISLKRGAKIVELEDVEKAYLLFLDSTRSIQVLKEEPIVQNNDIEMTE